MLDNVFASGKPDGKHELLSTAIKEGFLHPNCRHPLVTYIEGITQIPQLSPYDKTRENYEAEKKQRQIELLIRRFKREQAISQAAERAAEADRKIKEWQQKMKNHLADNPQLRRQPQREKLMPLPKWEVNPVKPVDRESIVSHGLEQAKKRGVTGGRD
ncbi:MAG: hypothetical protein Q4P08_06255 [Eubacteriales bacterium]|nr:hypothetical protein [Eubacteriales bacterium]